MAGAPIGRHFGLGNRRRDLEPDDAPRDDGSCIVVIATDAPLDGRQLARVAKRAGLGLGRTGSHGGNGSGELLVAFSTTYRPGEGAGRGVTRASSSRTASTHIFIAAIDATEEAVLNALCMATTTTGRHGHVIDALPLDETRELLKHYGVTDNQVRKNGRTVLSHAAKYPRAKGAYTSPWMAYYARHSDTSSHDARRQNNRRRRLRERLT